MPELTRNATFNLDYTISEKQIFRMKTNNICEIKVSKKELDRVWDSISE